MCLQVKSLLLNARGLPSKHAKCPSSPPHALAPSKTSSLETWYKSSQEGRWDGRRARCHCPRCPLLPPKATIIIQVCGPWHPTCGILSPMKAQVGLVPPNRPPIKVLQRQTSAPSKDLKSKHHGK
jgi:hypothetical protein